jgi:hypothetical protein
MEEHGPAHEKMTMQILGSPNKGGSGCAPVPADEATRVEKRPNRGCQPAAFLIIAKGLGLLNRLQQNSSRR